MEALQAQGFHVTRISGAGVPDLLVSRRLYRPGIIGRDDAAWIQDGVCWLVEIKTPTGKPTKAQEAFRLNWQGPPIITLRSVDQALKFQLLAMEGGQS